MAWFAYLAADPSLNPSDLSVWLLGFIAFLSLIGGMIAVAVGIKKLFEPQKRSEQTVSRSEWDEVKTTLAQCASKTEVRELERRLEMCATKSEVQALQDVMEKNEIYSRTRLHELSNALAPVPTQVAVINKSMDTLQKKLDDTMVRIERLLAFAEANAKFHGDSSKISERASGS